MNSEFTMYLEMAQMLPNLESQISKFASFQDAFGKNTFSYKFWVINFIRSS